MGTEIAYDLDTMVADPQWESGDSSELAVHRIHHYPAKFKSFIITKSLEHARSKGKRINIIADTFCGCGTSAFEARRNGIDFWGCDINPVATLIAKVKSEKYTDSVIERYYDQIVKKFEKTRNDIIMEPINERILYWFEDKQMRELSHLKAAIFSIVPDGKNRNFFLVGFSNILKGTSRWLAKSIKPQVDPDKKPQDVLDAFKRQIKVMRKAFIQSSKELSESKITIETSSILEPHESWPKVDMIVTSPPYVTSYEYADIHQLSTLWLGYVDDYRSLRKGTIGSKGMNFDNTMLEEINDVGKGVYYALKSKDSGIAKSVTKYFLDMSKAVDNMYDLLSDDGIIFLVIGNTKYRSVEVDNVKFICQCMNDRGFENIDVKKRKISSKTLTPYRDKGGKFRATNDIKSVYAYEYVIIGEKSPISQEVCKPEIVQDTDSTVRI